MRTDHSVHRRLERAVQRFGNESLEAASAWAKLASTHQRRQEYLPALSAFGRAWRIRQATLGSDCVLVANVRQSMGVINLRLAEELAVAGRSSSSNLLRAITSLSEAHRERAVTHLSEAHQVKSSRLGAGHIDTADALYQLGLACASAGRLDESIGHLLLSLEIRSVVLGDENLVLVETLETIASVHLLREEYGPAMQALASATRSRILIHGRDRDRNRQAHRQALAAFDLQFRVFLSRWETQEYELAVLAFHESTRIAQRYFVHEGEDLEQMRDDHGAWVVRIGNWMRFEQSRNASTSQERNLPTSSSTEPEANSPTMFIRDARTPHNPNPGVPTSAVPLPTSAVQQRNDTTTAVETERRHQTTGTDLTAGNGLATDEYQYPEIVQNRAPFDGYAVDMWAIGVILYIMLTGDEPRWRTEPTHAVNENHTHSEELFNPFNSMTFSEVKTVTCIEKAVNFSKAFTGQLDQFETFIPFWKMVSCFLGMVLELLTFLFRIFACPLQILVEAHDLVSEVENTIFLIPHSEITGRRDSDYQRRANETKTRNTRSDLHQNNVYFSPAGGKWA